jgi:hypothetical protein
VLLICFVQPEPSDVVDAAEKEQLKKVDYAFNLQEQGRSEPRDPILFTGKKVKDYPQLTTRQQPDRRCKVTTPDALAEERQRAKSEWDTFRSAIKGQGLSVAQQSKLYQHYKAQGQLDVHEEPTSTAPSAVKTETERELDVFHSLVKEEDLSLEELSMLYQDYKANGLLDDRKPASTAPEAERSRAESEMDRFHSLVEEGDLSLEELSMLYQDYQADGLLDDRKPASSPPEADRSRAESEWDRFRREVKGLGYSRQEQSELYEDYKAHGLLGDGPVEPPRSTSPVARSRAESEWDIFRRSVKDLGLSREEQSALYEDYKASGLLEDGPSEAPRSAPAATPAVSRSRAESDWDVFRRSVKDLGLSREEQSALYEEYKAEGLLDDRKPASSTPEAARSRAESEWDVFRRSVKNLGYSRQEQSELYEDYKAHGLLGDSVEPTRSTSPVSRPRRAESEWDVFRREVRGQGLSRQEQSERYQERVGRRSSSPPARSPYERARPEPATRAPPPPPSNPFNAFQQAHAGEYTRAQMAPAYHASRQSAVSHATPAHVPRNAYNAFQQAHAGMYTRAQMAPAYHAYRQSMPSHSAPTHVPRNPYNAFQQANAGRYSRSEMSAAYRAHKSGRG